jgi:hypothetical protein
MLRNDFVTLIGSRPGKADYIPVACLLRNGYGVAGYYNTPVNEGLVETCVLVNARLLDLTHSQESRRGVHHFGDFVEEIVTRMMKEEEFTDDDSDAAARIGGTVPLTAVPYGEISVVYPISQIRQLLHRVQEDPQTTPTFLDFQNKSIVVKMLTTRLW